MTKRVNRPRKTTEELAEESVLSFHFPEGPESTVFTMVRQNVTCYQLAEIAKYVEVNAELEIAEQVRITRVKQAQDQIQVPKGGLLT